MDVLDDSVAASPLKVDGVPTSTGKPQDFKGVGNEKWIPEEVIQNG